MRYIRNTEFTEDRTSWHTKQLLRGTFKDKSNNQYTFTK